MVGASLDFFVCEDSLIFIFRNENMMSNGLLLFTDDVFKSMFSLAGYIVVFFAG